MIKFTVLLPCHNESEFLPYSLPSIFGLNPSEILFLLDRCTDDSKDVILSLCKRHNFLGRCYIIEFNEPSPSWRTRLAYLQHVGRCKASYDQILFTGADLVLDQKIGSLLPNLYGGVQLLSFMHKDFPVNRSNLMKRLRLKFTPSGLREYNGLAGVLFYDRKVAWRLENIDSLMDIEDAEDSHLKHSISVCFNTKVFLTNTIHLRPRGKERDYLCGRLYWSVCHRPFLVTFLNALWTGRLGFVKGYIHERYGR